MGRHVYIGGFVDTSRPKILMCDVLVGEKRSFKEGKVVHEFGRRRLQFLEVVPDVWKGRLKAYLKRYNYKDFALPVGIIKYRLKRRNGAIEATSIDYMPYLSFEHEDISPRIAYFIEEMVVKCIKKEWGVTHISTTKGASDDREKQLSRPIVNLPVNKMVPVDEWIAGLVRGKQAQIAKLMVIARREKHTLRKD